MSTNNVVPFDAFVRRGLMRDKAVVTLNDIIRRGLRSLRSERFKRREFARRLGMSVQSLANIERGHRKLLAAELLLFAYAMNETPQWVLEEIFHRFKDEIDQWHRESGF